MTEQDVIKKHSDIILKKIIQMYKLYERKHKQANKKLGEYGNCDGSSRYWKIAHSIDLYGKEMNNMLKEMNDLNKLTGWYELKFQERYNFIDEEVLDTYELNFKDKRWIDDL